MPRRISACSYWLVLPLLAIYTIALGSGGAGKPHAIEMRVDYNNYSLSPAPRYCGSHRQSIIDDDAGPAVGFDLTAVEDGAAWLRPPPPLRPSKIVGR